MALYYASVQCGGVLTALKRCSSSLNTLAPSLYTQRLSSTHNREGGREGAVLYCGAFVQCIVACIIRLLFPLEGGLAIYSIAALLPLMYWQLWMWG